MDADGILFNGLVYAMDKPTTATPSAIVNKMIEQRNNFLRMYTGWGSPLTTSLTSPMPSTLQTKITQILTLCKQNNFPAILSIADQHGNFASAYPDEEQLNINGDHVFGYPGGTFICPSGEKYRQYTQSLIRQYITLCLNVGITPWIGVDEFVYIGQGNDHSFYSQSMKAKYLAQTGLQAPNVQGSRSTWSTSQRNFIDFCALQMQEFFREMEEEIHENDPKAIFGVMIDAYWVYDDAVYWSQPWDYYRTVGNLTFERFDSNYQSESAAKAGMQRIIDLNPKASHHFIYGRATSTGRKLAEWAKEMKYESVQLYEYYNVRDSTFDISDITGTPAGVFWCPYCSLPFTSQSELNAHIATNHVGSQPHILTVKSLPISNIPFTVTKI